MAVVQQGCSTGTTALCVPLPTNLPTKCSTVTAIQITGDIQAVLNCPEAVPLFLQCMDSGFRVKGLRFRDTYTLASGQCLNVDKVELLP